MRLVRRPGHPMADEFNLVPIELAYDNSEKGSAPAVISDTMDPIKHMGTGRMIDSKSRFRQDTKASGCIELGNETIKPRKLIQLDRRERREAIQRSIYNLKNGHA